MAIEAPQSKAAVTPLGALHGLNTLGTARERSEGEYRAFFEESGFVLERTVSYRGLGTSLYPETRTHEACVRTSCIPVKG